MPRCINGLRIHDLVRNQGFNHFGNQAHIVMRFRMEMVLKVPFGQRLHRFRADDNETTPIRVRTPPHTLPISLASRAMKAKQNGIEFLAIIGLRGSHHQSP